MKQDLYRRIVSGEKQGWAFSALRGVLAIVSFFYGVGVRVRNLCYNVKLYRAYSASVPVISVGNITAGGTGKTPLVIWLCRYLQGQGVMCSILTRGYKTRPGAITDEPALLARACEGATVVVNPDRIAGAKKAAYHHGAKVLVMDDGFQHRRLGRDMDIVIIDATCPFGYGKMIPAGLLREPMSSLSRASAVVITRTDLASESDLQQLEAEIGRYVGGVPVVRTTHKLTGMVCNANTTIGLDELRDKPVYAFCGIGNPDAFFGSLESSSMKLVGTEVFDDHHTYTSDDMERIVEQAKTGGAEAIVCTQKDWVKSALLLRSEKEKIAFGYMAMELDFTSGCDKITSLIDDTIKPQTK